MNDHEPVEPQSTGPKYKLIYRELRRALIDQTYSAGDRLPSESELVEQFGASRPTVGRALAQLESEGLIVRRAGSGTFACAQNRGDDDRVFGLLIPGLGTTEIFEPICRGISMARVGKRHDLLWGTTFSPGSTEEDQAEQLCDYYVNRNVAGVFFAPLELSQRKDEINQRIVAALDEAHISIVLLDRDIVAYPRRSKYDLVSIDNRRAGFAITCHMLECGAQRLIFLACPDSAPTVSERALGFQQAVASCENPAISCWTELGDPSQTAFVGEMISRLNPDAIVCANDLTAAKLMTSLNTLAVSVPSQVKVTGIDDVRYASMLQTPLTTIHQPCLELGAAAMTMMLNRIAHPLMPTRDCLIDFKLIVRQSTDPGFANALSIAQQDAVPEGLSALRSESAT
jgi:GntR family transcriptional regulator, arabinose operon transcriptional repressor